VDRGPDPVRSPNLRGAFEVRFLCAPTFDVERSVPAQA